MSQDEEIQETEVEETTENKKQSFSFNDNKNLDELLGYVRRNPPMVIILDFFIAMIFAILVYLFIKL